MSDHLQRSDYREVREYLEEKDTVEDIIISRRRIDHKTLTDLYLGFTCSAAGIRLWDLHDEFDLDVVYSWHDPTIDRLRMGVRLRQ